MAYSLIVLAIISAITYFVFSSYRASAAKADFCQKHGCQEMRKFPQSERILGLSTLFEIRGVEKAHRVLDYFTEKLAQSGPTFSVQILRNNILLTSDPENIKTILATQFQDYSVEKRKTIFSPLLGNGIFVSDGEAWQHSRALIRPAFSRAQFTDLSLFERHLGPLLDELLLSSDTVDLGPLFFQLTADVTFSFLLGDEDPSPRERKRRQEVCEAFDYAQEKLGDFGNYGWKSAFFRWNKFHRSTRLVHNYADEYVTKALQRISLPIGDEASHDTTSLYQPDRYVFLDELMKVTTDPIKIREELLNILLAGRDTTASLLTIAFHAISRREDVMEKLRREVNLLGGVLPDYEALKNMSYLQYTLKEVQRLWPVVPMNSRMANKDTVLPFGGGSDGRAPSYIPRRRTVNYSVYAMHRDKSVYGEDADDFRPERWEHVRPGWHYLPFHGGPRVCPGQNFALLEASYTIVRMLQAYGRIESRDPLPIVEKLDVTFRSRNGAKVALFKS